MRGNKLSWVLIFLLFLTLSIVAAPKLVFEDNFDKDTGKWVSYEGDWVIENGYLVNKDVNHTVSNVACDVMQKGNKVTYEYKVYMEETVVEYGPLCGLHFYVDNPAERGDSYFVYQAKPFLIKVAKTGTTEAIINPLGENVPGSAELGKEYILKIVLDNKKAIIIVYVNGEEVGYYDVYDEQLDPTDYISFRTNRTKVKIDYIKVWVE